MQFGRLQRLIEWKQGNKPGPWTVSIYPTYRCNLKCGICWKRAAGEPLKPAQELSQDLLLRIVDDAATLGAKNWILGGAGELMLRPDLVMRVCARIRERGMNGMIQTNGTLFSEDHLDLLVEMGWEAFSVSIDGATPEINDEIRCKGAFDKSVAAIRRLNEFRRARKCDACKPGIASVVTSLNCNAEHLELLVRMAHELDAQLALVPLTSYGETTRRFEVLPQQKAALPAAVAGALEVARKLGVSSNLRPFLDGLQQSPKAFDLFHGQENAVSQRTMCYEPWLSLVIKPDGHAGPCCTMEYAAKADNVREKSLREIWYGGYMEKVRHAILAGQPPSYCAECSPNQVLETAAIQASEEWEPITARRLAERLLRSLRNNGPVGTLRRGREWLQIRRGAR